VIDGRFDLSGMRSGNSFASPRGKRAGPEIRAAPSSSFRKGPRDGSPQGRLEAAGAKVTPGGTPSPRWTRSGGCPSTASSRP